MADPKQTLDFDDRRQHGIDARVAAVGTDGRLVPAPGGPVGAVHHATLAEKLLVPALAKLSNLVAGAGIWLNTQRPEWNDANNALVGNGVSTVTLLHLRDHLAFLDRLLAGSPGTVRIGAAVDRWLTGLEEAFADHDPQIGVGPEGDRDRRTLLDRLGLAFEAYRTELEAAAIDPDSDSDEGPHAPIDVKTERLRRFLATATPHLDHAAASAHRPDGLVHSYWLLHLDSGSDGAGRAGLEPLYEMLEGQVAALNSPDIDPADALGLVDALFDSDLYRPDQASFVLYPDRRPPPFTAKNTVPPELIDDALRSVVEADTGVLVTDDSGRVRFGAGLRSERLLAAALDELAAHEDTAELMAETRDEIEAAYEAVFRHRAFTGRSQTMYRYEGLGSVYWHMVSKLLFAIQQRVVEAVDRGDDPVVVAALADRYRRVRSGLGFAKSPAEQGSFPTDPHSHTPAHTGAQQPGMTGQVKEGVLIRWGELGVQVDGGRVRFRPLLLDPAEFLTEPRRWAPLADDDETEGELDAGTLGFTYCGVPVVYRLVDGAPRITIQSGGRAPETIAGDSLDRDRSRTVFARAGQITRIDVDVRFDSLLFPPPTPPIAVTEDCGRSTSSGR